MMFLKRIWPAILLVLITPIFAEYLLGSYPIQQIYLLGLVGPLYGFGALLIREIARQSGRGWPTIIALAFVYGVLEEAIGIQTLFNRDFMNMRLLEYGFIPALGMGAVYTVFVLSLHVIFSICTPIGLVELLFAKRRTEPWLGKIGLGVTALLYLVGLGIIFAYFIKTFSASPFQYGIAAFMILAGLAAALFVSVRDKAAAPLPGTAPSPWLLAVLAFAGSSTLWLLLMFAQSKLHLPAAVTVLAMLALDIGGLLYIFTSARRKGWSNLHRLALVAGPAGTYFWIGQVNLWARGPAVIASQFGLIATFIALMVFIWWRLRRDQVM